MISTSVMKFFLCAAVAAAAALSVSCERGGRQAEWWEGERERIEFSQQLELKKYRLEQVYTEDFEELDDDFHSPIDNVEELHFLNDVLKVAYMREPEVYRLIQAALPSETVACCQLLFAAVDAQRAVTPSP